MVFLEGGKGGFQELADTSKGGEESRREGKTAAKRARVRPMHVIMLPMTGVAKLLSKREELFFSFLFFSFLSALAEMDDNPLALPFLSRLVVLPLGGLAEPCHSTRGRW